MTTPNFQKQFPKPWRWVRHSQTFTLHAANDVIIGSLQLGSRHAGIPQAEWNRHVTAALQEYMEVTDREFSRETLFKQAEAAIAP